MLQFLYMDNHRGFVTPLIILVVLLVLAGGIYGYVKNKEQDIRQQVNQRVTESPIMQTNLQTDKDNGTTPTSSTKKVPQITILTPSSGQKGTVVTAQGYFPLGATILFGDETIGTVVTEEDSYTFVVPTTLPQRGFGAPPEKIPPGEYPISLVTSSSTVPQSSILFTVTAPPVTVLDASAPRVVSISAERITSGVNTTLTLRGSNFSPTNTISIVGAGRIVSTGPTQVSPDGTSLSFVFPETIVMPALYNISVYARGGVQGYVVGGPALLSSSVTVTLINPYAPTITAVTPSSAVAGATVTVYGKNFYGDTRVFMGTYLPSVSLGAGPITPASYTSTELTFIIPAGIDSGKYVVQVSGSSGHTSNSAYLTVRAQ